MDELTRHMEFTGEKGEVSWLIFDLQTHKTKKKKYKN